MYWLRQPPYMRWIAAAVVICFGLFLDMRPAAGERYPFVTATVAIGAPVEPMVEWRDIPTGVLPTWDHAVTGVAVAEIAAGSPLLPSLTTDIVIPEGWWAVSLPLPQLVTPGRPVRVIVDGAVAEGVLVGEIVDSGFELTGLVAFPSVQASQVAAAAAADSALVVMIGS